MHTIVEIRGLEILCIIGVKEKERPHPQRISVDADVHYAAAPARDDLGEAIDYSLLAAEYRRIAREGRFGLVEMLARRLAEETLESFAAAARVRVTVRKPYAVRNASSVGATVELHRAEAGGGSHDSSSSSS